jgi:predicted AlkP superfamily pyrophosphatase or phosphodiesterase
LKVILTLVVGLFLLSLRSVLPTALSNAVQPPRLTNHVIIISIDGLRPDALQQAETMNLKALWKGGAYSWRAQTVFPSITLPAHASMLSGVTIDKHGITWNDWQPSRGFITVPTVFSIAHEAGLTTAAVVGKIKLLTLCPPDVVDFFDDLSSDADVGRTAAEYFLTHQPSVLFIHLADTDTAGHTYGWMSPEQLQAIRKADQALTPLLAALRKTNLLDRTLIIVTADHGGHGRTHGTALPEDMVIPWIVFGSQVKRDYQIEPRVRVYDTAATALYALGLPIPESWDGKPIAEVFASPLSYAMAFR